MTEKKPCIAILGAGPTGLEAALAAAEAGYPFRVYEASTGVAGHIRNWEHVQLFTPWDLNVSARIRHALEQAGEDVPEGTECPTGAALIDRVLGPVSALSHLAPWIRYGTRAHRLGRTGLLKHEEIGTGRRSRHTFRLLLRDDSGREWTEEADVVIDCTGNTDPNALGDGGIPAPGEAAAVAAISHEIPDVRSEREPWAGRTTLVVGGGHSATTAVAALVELADGRPGTEVIWALRDTPADPDPNDPLGQRAALLAKAAELCSDPPSCLRVPKGVVVDAVTLERDDSAASGASRRVRVELRHEDGQIESVEVDHILALTGKVGDHLLYRQLQVHECWATQGPMKLAAALLAQSGDSGDCLDHTSLGAETLINPEPDLFILGIKSYGRRSDFLMRVGWEQVDEVFTLLARG